ncbi:MAG: sulfur carrier protein ThiS [Desulfitobacteriaceae bacterium]
MKLNGQIFQLNRNISLLQYLQENKYDISIIAVELNGNIVPKTIYSDIMLQEEDILEVVSFVGGG